MKFFTQLSTLAVSVLLLSVSTNASPTADLEAREPVPEPAPVIVGDVGLSAPFQLEKRRKKHHGSGNKTDSNDATSLASDGTLRLTGVAFLSSAMFLLA